MARGRGDKRRGRRQPGKTDGPRLRWKKPGGGYKAFRIGSLFDIRKGKRLTKANMRPGSINFIGATAGNNGVTAKVGNDECVHPAGTITVTYNGSVGEAFYQTEPFWASDDVNVLYPKFPSNERVCLFFLAPLAKKGKQYGYNFKWTKDKMENDTIELPVTEQGAIDFPFMEECVRELETNRVRELEMERRHELEVYLREAGFGDCRLNRAETEALRALSAGKVKFRNYRIGSLFDVATGRDIIIGRTREGSIPLISHQHNDNGISKRIARLANRRLFDFRTTLPLADRGVFLATTQAENFHIGTRVKALTFRSGIQTENVRLFFVAAINKLQVLFTEYLDNATDNLPNLQIMLPVDGSGNVDYAFMDTCIGGIKKTCIGRLRKAMEKEHEAYERMMHSQRL